MNLKMLLFLSLALAISTDALQLNPGFISIDCGAASEYVDENLKIYCQTDEGFVSSGTIMQVSAQELYKDPESSNLQQFKTMRVFPNGTRNCYTLRPKQGKGNTYLIKASFRYGNYDGRYQAPSFDLHIDVNYWATLRWASEYVAGGAELIYVSPRDDIQVCLVNIGSGIPFISSLELRFLDNATYRVDSGALLVRQRSYYNGNSSTRIRHPDDEYDRLWTGEQPNKPSLRHIITANTTVKFATSNDTYKVPEVVLKTALESQNTSTPLEANSSNSGTVRWYFNLYFAELQVLPKNQVREFEVSVSDKVIATLRPQFGEPVTVVNAFPPSGMNLNFMMRSTARSDLPAILNAIEIMVNFDLPNTMTALDDVKTMNGLKKAYNVLKDSWQGDPCVPKEYIWEGLSCSYDNGSPPRVISLNLASSMLTGDISRLTSVSKLLALETLDISHNQLIGQVPEFLGNLPNLKVLDLTANNLSGSIPEIIQKRVSNKSLQLRITGNPNICIAEPCNKPIKEKKKKKNNTLFMILVFAFVATVVAVLIIGLAVLWRVRQQKKNGAGQSVGTIKSNNRSFTYNEVLKITENFKKLIGKGGFGKVYLDTLANGSKVAVKMLSQSSKQGFKEFQSEAELLMVVHHRNLVSLVGYCDDSQNMALIYEFMVRGNLREILSDKNANVLTWTERLRIALEITQGLDYLHNGCKPPIIHRDMKTPNILLNERMQAKIADFGLSKVFAEENDSHISTRAAGTPGYLDPASRITRNFNRKSDVYSFGVILLELVTGHPPIIRSSEGYVHILQWANPIIESGDINGIVDPRLNNQFNINSAWKLVKIAVSCASGTAAQRPDISQVLSELKECWDVETAVEGIQRMGSSLRQRSTVDNSILEAASSAVLDDSTIMPR